MNEIDINLQAQRRKTSKVAMASAMISVLVITHWSFAVVVSSIFPSVPMVNDWLEIACWINLTLLLGLILGVAALIQIKRSKGQLRGRPEAIIGIIIGSIYLASVIAMIMLARLVVRELLEGLWPLSLGK